MSTSQEDLLQFCVKFYTDLRKDQLRLSEEELLQQFLETQKYLIEMISFRKDLEKAIEINAIEQIHKETIVEMFQTIKEQQTLINDLSTKIHQVENEALQNLNHTSGISSNATKPDDPNYQAIFQQITSLKRAIENIEPVIQVKNVISDSFQEQLNDERQYLSLLQNVHRNRLFQFQLKKNMFEQSKYSQQLCWKQGQDLINSLLNLRQYESIRKPLPSNNKQQLQSMQHELQQKEQVIVLYEQKLAQLHEQLKTKAKLLENRQKQYNQNLKKKQKQLQKAKAQKQKTIQQMKVEQSNLQNKLNIISAEKHKIQEQLYQKQQKLQQYTLKLTQSETNFQKLKQKKQQYEKQNKEIKKDMQKMSNNYQKLQQSHQKQLQDLQSKCKTQSHEHQDKIQQLNEMLNEQKLHSKINEDQLRAQLVQKNGLVSNLQNQLKENKKQLAETHKKLSEKIKQITQLKKIVKNKQNQLLNAKKTLWSTASSYKEKQTDWKLKQEQMIAQHKAILSIKEQSISTKQQQLQQQYKTNKILLEHISQLQQKQNQMKQFILNKENQLKKLQINVQQEQYNMLKNLQRNLQRQLHSDWEQKITILDRQVERISQLI